MPFNDNLVWRYLVQAENSTIAELETAVGGLSRPSKMPWYSYSLPASACLTGSWLRENVPGSVCGSCYACKGRYKFDAVQQAQMLRLSKLSNINAWTASMHHLLQRRATGECYFRWHDSGDVQSIDHFLAICWLANSLPRIHFWLPTKEVILGASTVPSNMIVRVSAPMIGQHVESKYTSTVGIDSEQHQCKAKHNDGKCGTCRKCWSRSVQNINYPLH